MDGEMALSYSLYELESEVPKNHKAFLYFIQNLTLAFAVCTISKKIYRIPRYQKNRRKVISLSEKNLEVCIYNPIRRFKN